MNPKCEACGGRLAQFRFFRQDCPACYFLGLVGGSLAGALAVQGWVRYKG